MVDEHGENIHARSGKIGSNLVLGSLYPHKITLSTKVKTGKIGENALKTICLAGGVNWKRMEKTVAGLGGQYRAKIRVFRQRCGEK